MESLFITIMLMGIVLALFFPIEGDWGGIKRRYKQRKSGV